MQDAKRKLLDCTLAADRTVRGCRGFTLMELMVYIAIVGIVVIVAGQAFSNSTKMRVRTQSMLKASEVAENVATLFKTDVAQTGAKSSMEATVAGGDDSFSSYTECTTANGSDCIYIDPNNSTENSKDSSSYKITAVTGSAVYDNLTVRRIRYDESGHYRAIEQIDWFVENKTLKRSCKILRKVDGYTLPSDDLCEANASKTPTPVEIATGVEKFKVYPSLPIIRSNASTGYTTEKLFPAGSNQFKFLAREASPNIIVPTTMPDAGGESVTISGFARNYDDDEAGGSIIEDGLDKNELYAALNTDDADEWNSDCQKFTLDPGIEYEISFTMVYGTTGDNMQLFVAGRDHMSVGFRDTDGNRPPAIRDFLFYPPASAQAQGKRAMRLTVPQKVEDVCLAFTFATYSPVAGTGSVTISNLKFSRIPGSTYTFDKSKTVNITDKKNVKALMLELQVSRGGTDNKAGESGQATIVVPIPSNGVGI